MQQRSEGVWESGGKLESLNLVLMLHKKVNTFRVHFTSQSSSSIMGEISC